MNTMNNEHFHNVDTAFSNRSMQASGNLPWAGVGVSVNTRDPLSMLDVAGINWTIERSPVQFADSNCVLHTVPNRHALYRSDNHAGLSVVSDRYKIVQPRDIVGFFQTLAENNHMQIETLGAMKGGRIIWAMASNNASAFTLGTTDEVKMYTLLVTSCDGSMATRAFTTSLRFVCTNMLHAISKECDASVTVKHSTSFDANSVRQRLGVNADQLETFAGTADNLAHKSMTDKQFVEFVCDLYVKRDNKENVTNERTLKTVTADIMKSYKTGEGAHLSTSRGTAWGALNAVTHYIDHSTSARTNENRFYSSQFGAGSNIKHNAVALLTEQLETFQDIPRGQPVLATTDQEDGAAFNRFMSSVL